ncbi:MAG: hypothetical protein ACT4OD_01070 [Candidatus Nitrosotenuis sp.]
MSDSSQSAPKEQKESSAGAQVQAATTQAELAATKLATAKAILDAAEKEYESAMNAMAKAAAEAEKEYAAIAKAAQASAASKPLTNKRNQERIFRREMGEPEFFRYKKDLIPKRIMLSEEEQEEVSRKVEIPIDATPQYRPQHVLSVEYGGTSNYESGISDLVKEAKQKLANLKNDPSAAVEDIIRTEKELEYLDSLYESFYYGMNVFRTAQNGRAKLEHTK